MKKDYRDTFIKTFLKASKVTTPNIVFLNELNLNNGWIYVNPRVKLFVQIKFFIKYFKDRFLIN